MRAFTLSETGKTVEPRFKLRFKPVISIRHTKQYSTTKKKRKIEWDIGSTALSNSQLQVLSVTRLNIASNFQRPLLLSWIHRGKSFSIKFVFVLNKFINNWGITFSLCLCVCLVVSMAEAINTRKEKEMRHWGVENGGAFQRNTKKSSSRLKF